MQVHSFICLFFSKYKGKTLSDLIVLLSLSEVVAYFAGKHCDYQVPKDGAPIGTKFCLLKLSSTEAEPCFEMQW